jgi:hypothetical protein
MKTEIIRGEILGVPVDFKIETEVKGDAIHQTISGVMPQVRYDAKENRLIVFSPPLMERPITERELREMRLMGFNFPNFLPSS